MADKIHVLIADDHAIVRQGLKQILSETEDLVVTGETDDGANIDATLTTFMTKFGADNLKRVKWLYLFGRMGGGVNVTFKPDEGLGYTYPSVGVDDGTIRMHRARPGGKVRGTYYEFTIQNVNGSKFHIDRVEAIVDTTTRAM